MSADGAVTLLSHQLSVKSAQVMLKASSQARLDVHASRHSYVKGTDTVRIDGATVSLSSARGNVSLLATFFGTLGPICQQGAL
eukprot:COSAG01_NODE_40073_length_468_cov_0.696477_1_plen_82_part_10